MKIIIFAGGVGKRLWPISRKDSPKQFHPLYREVSNSFDIFLERFKPEDIFISTGEDYLPQIRQILPNIPEDNIILEPMSRDNGPAVGYAMLKLFQKFPDEPVVIRWQNSLSRDPKAFMSALLEANTVLEKKEASLVYLAVPSRYPNTGLGYIRLGEKNRDLNGAISLHDFGGFVEKPNLELAKKYQESGEYAWNPGCYITTPRFILEKLEEKNPALYQNLQTIQNSFGAENESEVTRETFLKMEKISIDYALWERLGAENIKVVLAEYQWYYVSTWADLKKALQKDPDENVLKGLGKFVDAKNNLIYNFDDKKLVAIVGLSGIEVIHTKDAILIVGEEKAGKVKDLVGELETEGRKEFI